MPHDVPETPAPVIRPTQWERIGFETKPGLALLLWTWTWRQVRLAGLHLVVLAKNPMTWKVIAWTAGFFFVVLFLYAVTTRDDRRGDAQCATWADLYGLKVAWDKDVDKCLGTKKSVLGDGNVWLKRPFYINAETGELAWIQSTEHEEPPSVSPSDEDQCYAWGDALKADLTWVADIRRCIGYRKYTPRQIASGTLQSAGWERPYKVDTISGKRSWLERPY